VSLLEFFEQLYGLHLLSVNRGLVQPSRPLQEHRTSPVLLKKSQVIHCPVLSLLDSSGVPECRRIMGG
jgi:hypothetical protein